MDAVRQFPACNKEHMLLWVQGLESEEFPQGTGALNEDGKFCCMGVACEVAFRNGVPLHVTTARDGIQVKGVRVSYDGRSGYHPTAVQTWLGFQSYDGEDPVIGFQADGTLVSAQEANDILEWTLPEIAASIRVYYGLGDK